MQRGRVYKGHDYQLMETVNCLWIIINSPVNLQNRVFSLEACYRETKGDAVLDSSGLCHISCVYVGNPDDNGISGLSRIVDTLFFKDTVNQRDERLKKHYNIELDDSTKEGLRRMSFAEEYIEGSIEAGLERYGMQLTVKHIAALVSKESWDIDQAIELFEVPEDYVEWVRSEVMKKLSDPEQQ